jgi:plasmid stabilization system protein ParE
MSKYRIVFSPDAKTDVQEAIKWYNGQRKGLGTRFRQDIEQVVLSIKANPFFASVKYKNIRTAACKVFPFSIHYEISETENLIRVLSVFHFSQRPKE